MDDRPLSTLATTGYNLQHQPMLPIIQATDIRKSYGDLQVLKGIDLSISRGEIVSIVGASGAGKTTLLQILGTLMSAEEGGRLVIDTQEVSRLSAKATAELRSRWLGFVFQSHQLLPELTALENVLVPSLIIGTDSRAARERAGQLLSMLGLEERAHHKPRQMSGGECQRVAVARALMNEPKVIFADEPSGSLDTQNKDELHSLFFRLRDELGQTIVLVTHDPTLAARADRCITLRDGRVVS